jgi:glucose/arabinose dehydrogenase
MRRPRFGRTIRGPIASVALNSPNNRVGFWQHPPPDWFLGDETEAMKGLATPSGPATPTDAAELEKDLSKIKLRPGFKIEVWASGLPEARQMAWGDDGTLFVGSFGATNVYAVKDEGGKRTVKTIVKGLNMPTGVSLQNGALYVVAINKLLRYDNVEASLDHMPEPVVVYDDMPPYTSHGWKYLADDHKAGFISASGHPSTSVSRPPAWRRSAG